MPKVGTTKISGGASIQPAGKRVMDKKERTSPGSDLAGTDLYIEEILGDGNCLFRALSMQLYGDDSKHAEVRTRVTAWQREHVDELAAFSAVNVDEHQRLRSKKQEALDYDQTAEGLRQKFLADVKFMEKSGCWGSEMEVQAFAQVYNTCVELYRFNHSKDLAPTPILYGSEYAPSGVVCIFLNRRRRHYQSLRNRDGPHTGVPDCRRVKIGSGSNEKKAAVAMGLVKGLVEAGQPKGKKGDIAAIAEKKRTEMRGIVKGEDEKFTLSATTKDEVPPIKRPKRRHGSETERIAGQGGDSDNERTSEPAVKKVRLAPPSLSLPPALVPNAPTISVLPISDTNTARGVSNKRKRETVVARTAAVPSIATTTTTTSRQYVTGKGAGKVSDYDRDHAVSPRPLPSVTVASVLSGQKRSRTKKMTRSATRPASESRHDLSKGKGSPAMTSKIDSKKRAAAAPDVASTLPSISFSSLPSFKKTGREGKRKRSFSQRREDDSSVAGKRIEADKVSETSVQHQQPPNKKIKLDNVALLVISAIGSANTPAGHGEDDESVRTSTESVPQQIAVTTEVQEQQEQRQMNKPDSALSIFKPAATIERHERRQRLETLSVKKQNKKRE